MIEVLLVYSEVIGLEEYRWDGYSLIFGLMVCKISYYLLLLAVLTLHASGGCSSESWVSLILMGLGLGCLMIVDGYCVGLMIDLVLSVQVDKFYF